MTKTAKKVRCIAAWLVLVLAFLSLAPAATTEAATPEAYIFLKGSSPRKKYTSSKPRYIYVGGKKVNFDYYVDGKTKGVKGTWASSDKKIVTVDKSGIARAVGNGKATISFTFTYKGKKYSMKTHVVGRTRAESCTVKVVEPSDFDGTMEVGGWIDINRTLKAKAKARAVTPGIKSTYKAYGELYDDEDCTIVHDGSVATLGDKFIVTGEGDGVVYFKANARNSKTNMDYNVDSNVIKITVGEGKQEEEDKPDETLVTGATQTDVDKIKVTSTTDINSITIKMGNTILSQRKGSPEIAADKKSAIVSLPGNYQTATYTVLINDVTSSAIEVKCETRRLEKMELDSPYAVLDREVISIINNKTDNPKATVRYRVFDQFGNDVTKSAAFPVSDFYSGGIFQLKSQGVMEFEFSYNPVIGTKYDVVLVHQGSAKTMREQVELVKPAVVEKISFAGIYRYDASKASYELMADETVSNMAEGTATISAFGGSVSNTKTHGAYYMLFKAENQYGGNAAAAGVGFNSLVVNLSPGTTGLAIDTVKENGQSSAQIQSINPITVNNVEHLAYPLKSGTLKEGTAYLTAFAVGSSTNINTTLKVNSKMGIKTFTISAAETLYDTKPTYLNYSVVDTYGNNVTDYNTLVKYCGLNSGGTVAEIPANSEIIRATNSQSKFAWEKQSDGSAKLRYTPQAGQSLSANTTGTDTIQTMLNTVNVQFYTFSLYAKPLPTEFAGVRAEAELGALINGKALHLRTKDLLVYDQYGQEMSAELLKKSGYSFKVSEPRIDPVNAFKPGSHAAISSGIKFDSGADSLTGDGTGIYQTILKLETGSVAGTASFMVTLIPPSGSNNTKNLMADITMRAVEWGNLSTGDYQVEPMGTLSNADGSEHEFVVTGNSGGTRIIIPKDDYTIVATSSYAQKFLNQNQTAIIPNKVNLGESTSNKEGLGYPINSNNCRKVTFTYQIVINDGNATMITTDVVITDEMRKASVVEASSTVTDRTITTGRTIWAQIKDKKMIVAKDQYGVSYDDFTNDIVRVTVSSKPNTINVNKNGTPLAQVTSGTGKITVQVFINDLAPITLELEVSAGSTGGTTGSPAAISLPASFWSV